ncbi:MAG: DsbA family protein [Elusimicrobia bacterium]|nr:DsbA family protein [Elusimicrobiota bacterium]
MKKPLLLLTLFLAAPALAVDNAKLAQNLREMLNLDTRTEIVVQGEAVPSGIANLQKLVVLVGGAPYDVLITTDETKYIWGFSADMNVSPDHVRASQIKLDHVHSVGSADAPITIVEYSDLQCSHCKQAHQIMKDNLYKVYTSTQVRWVYKHFPLNNHPWALPAAVAAECASDQKPDAFWSMVDYFFKNQDDLDEHAIRDQSKAQAAALGIKTANFYACMDDPKMKDRVMADKKEGAGVGVQSTPTLFVNGRARRGLRDFDEIKVVIDEKLKELKAAK